MQRITIKWGFISGALMVGIPLATYLLIGGGPETFKISEIIGYATIILSLLLIFIAINNYRLLQEDNRVSFGKGFLLGLSISAIAGLMFGIYNWVFVEFMQPDFMDQYYDYYIEQIKQSGKPEAQVTEEVMAFEREKAMFMNTSLQFLIMFLTVFIIGGIVSIFSAAIQSRIQTQNNNVEQHSER